MVWVCCRCSIATYHSAYAQQAGQTTNPVPAAVGSSDNLDEIVVNGIRRGDLIMPTTVTSGSAYGLDLGVMDTPRNNTVLSKAQLDALDVQNPGGFSSLTSSAYSDASFGEPNIPRIRGQYADMFYNGMRDSFTLNGYGAPISFNMVDSIDIIKGPASVQGGAGPGVGGSIDIATKMPSMTTYAASGSVEVDTHQKRILNLDVGGPLANNVAGRLSFTSNDSGSYYYDMYFHQQSLIRRRDRTGDTQLQDLDQRRRDRYALPGERRHQPCESGPHRQQHATSPALRRSAVSSASARRWI